MDESEGKKLLRDRKVVEEISRHQWIESEKMGYDIGFEKASLDWLERFSKVWMRYHLPSKKTPSKQLKKASKKSLKNKAPSKRKSKSSK